MIIIMVIMIMMMLIGIPILMLKVDKLVLADSVIEQLSVDNDRLTNELGKLKETFKVTDI